jgi:hypothetical protein
LQLPAKGMHAPRAACGYSALVRRFTARRYSAAAGDALKFEGRLFFCVEDALLRRTDHGFSS